MSTLNDLIYSIHSALHSYSGTQEQATWLSSDITATDTTIPVEASETVLRGITEIDDELIYVHTTNASGLNVAPFGRGFRGSTAAAHAANTMVIFDPIFPKVEIRRAIDQCIEALFPTLYQIKTTTIAYDGIKVGIPLPADCEGVLEVKANHTADIIDFWQPLGRWKYDPTSALTGGKALNLMDDVIPTTDLRITYRAKFGTFADVNSTLASAGLNESYADLILYCVTSRLVRFLDPARLQLGTVENIARAQLVQAGDAGKVANQLYAMYQTRLQEERSRLLELFPPSINFTR